MKKGLKPKGPFSGRTAVFSGRLMPTTKKSLQDAAKKNNRSVSQEVEFLILQALHFQSIMSINQCEFMAMVGSAVDLSKFMKDNDFIPPER